MSASVIETTSTACATSSMIGTGTPSPSPSQIDAVSIATSSCVTLNELPPKSKDIVPSGKMMRWWRGSSIGKPPPFLPVKRHSL